MTQKVRWWRNRFLLLRISLIYPSMTPVFYLLFILLLPIIVFIALLYSIAVEIRLMLYRYRILKEGRVPLPVISVGNISSGGVGKTPLVQHLAECLKAEGLETAIITRGYRSELEERGEISILSRDGTQSSDGYYQEHIIYGDEPTMLSRNLPGVPVCIGANRMKAIGNLLEWTEKRGRRLDAIILDDGFSHLMLHRDIDILLLDAEDIFEGGLPIPLGLLREPPSSIKRADILCPVFKGTKFEQVVPPLLKNIEKPIFSVYLIPESFIRFPEMQRIELHSLKGKRAYIFSGIGKPYLFKKLVEEIGLYVAGHRFFRDHHRFDRKDLQDIERSGRKRAVDLFITTEKDIVRFEQANFNLPLCFLKLRVITRGRDGENLPVFIASLLKKGREP